MEKEWMRTYADRWIRDRSDLYAIESEAAKGLYYVAWKDELWLLKGHDMYRIGLHEADEWIRRCRDPEVAEEMAEIVADCKEYKRGEFRPLQKTRAWALG